MKNLFKFFALSILIFTSCQPKVTTLLFEKYQVFDQADEIKVFDENDTIAFNYILVGKTQAVGSMFSKDCEYDIMMERLKKEAGDAGGNAIQIVTDKLTKGRSKCHNLYANILDVDFDSPITNSRFYTEAASEAKTAEIKKKRSVFIEVDDQPYSKYDIGLLGAWSYQIGRIPDATSGGEPDYLNQLKTGYVWGVDFTYYLKDKIGLGAEFNSLSRDNSSDEEFSKRIHSVSEAITSNYYGAFFTTRNVSSNNKSFSCFRVGLGAMTYTNETKYTKTKDLENLSYTGVSPIINIGYNYNQKISSHFALGVGFTAYLSTSGVQNVWYDKIADGATIRDENLSRLQLSLQLKYLGY